MPVSAPSVGNPTKQSFAQDVVDSITDLEANYNTVLSLGYVTNGSFETDSDANNVPDGWTFTPQTAGTGVLDATTSAHGIKSFKITSLGSGNGGGSLQMTSFSECSFLVGLLFSWHSKSSVAGIKNLFEVRWYSDADEGDFISTSTLWSEDTNNPTDWKAFSAAVLPPATARYFKIKITGADSSDTTAGIAYFDNVIVTRATPTVTLSHLTTGDGGTFTSGAWRTRTLDTEVDTFGLCALSSNQFTLQPGRYSVNGYAIGSQVDEHLAKVYDITNSADVLVGSPGYCANTIVVNSLSVISGELVVTKPTTYELQHFCTTTRATDGFGNAGPSGASTASNMCLLHLVKIG